MIDWAGLLTITHCKIIRGFTTMIFFKEKCEYWYHNIDHWNPKHVKENEIKKERKFQKIVVVTKTLLPRANMRITLLFWSRKSDLQGTKHI